MICSAGDKGVFRLRGNNVQLVKSVAQPDGKAKNVGAGSINLVTGKRILMKRLSLLQRIRLKLKSGLPNKKK